MSHVASVSLDIKDLDALETTCASLGLKLIREQKTYLCWGTGRSVEQLARWQNTTQKAMMPEGFSLEDMGKCEHAIRVPGGHGYEIGLVARRDGRPGYQLFCDISGAHDIKAHAGPELNKLKQGYAVEVAKKAARRAGYRVVKTTVRKDGSIAILTQK